jgi:hypothetical protein
MDAWVPAPESPRVLVEPELLKALLETAFEASLLREENRPLVFRMILRDPDRFPPSEGPPEGLHRLLFSKPRPLTAPELKRLTPAVDYDRSLVGICLSDSGQFRIWGIVHSGPRWLEQFHGGRGNAFQMPDSLIVGVTAPGYMTISQGSRPVCAIEAGRLQSDRLNVFKSNWLTASFAAIRQELAELHAAQQSKAAAVWATIDANLTKMVAQQMTQRLISTVQRFMHGGTLLIIPPERADEFSAANQWVNLKYSFRDEEPRARFRALVVRVMRELAAAGPDVLSGKSSVGWDDYGRIRNPVLTNLDEAIFEMSHMIATLTQVDGAVVMTRRFDLLGFGGEIASALPEVSSVARALDLEAEAYLIEPTEDVGTRHRSVYRLCSARKDVLGIVVSQDGGATFVKWKDPHVTYWRHTTIASS